MAAHNPSVVFLCSGGGGNMRFLHQAGARIVGCITDRACGAEAYAAQHGIAQHRADFSAAGQKELVVLLQGMKPDIIVTNVHRILGADMLQHFAPQLVNLHYSLLPKYAGVIGAVPVQQAIDAGDAFTGVTLHRVTDMLDGGPILQQARVPLWPHDTVSTVMNAVFRLGCLALWHYWQHGASHAAAATFSVDGRDCVFDHWQAGQNPFPDSAPVWTTIREAV